MRPVKLTMTAFGPYAGEEVIDFAKLKDKNIFLITGPTGAGKTTIFDGISYAVFGSASSDERDGESLRSHFASEDLITSVELEFELKGKRYYIKRIPKQLKRKAKGDGFTEQKPEAYLELISDEKRDMCASGVNPVNERIAEILGINCAQFRQIMMIPQGEFRQLITASSKERDEILQKLFGTEGYKRVQDALNDKSKKLENAVKDYSNRLDENIHNLSLGENEELKELVSAKPLKRDEVELRVVEFIEQDKAEEARLALEVQKSDKAIVDKNTEIVKAEATNKKFENKALIEIEKRKLEISQPEIDLKVQRLLRVRKAMTISAAEESYQHISNALEARKNELQQAAEKALALEETRKAAEQLFKAEQEKEPMREGFFKEVTRLQGLSDKVKALEEKKNSVSALHKEWKAQENLVADKKAELDKGKAALIKIDQELQQISIAKDSNVRISEMLEDKNSAAEKIKRLMDENNKLTDIRNQLIKEQVSHNTIKAKYDQTKDMYEKLQDEFFKGQAGILSSTLEEGKPCPVCGSIHHPAPAHVASSVPDEAALNKAKAAFTDSQDKYNRSSENLNILLGQGKAQRDVVIKLKQEVHGDYGAVLEKFEKEQLTKELIALLESLNQEITRLKGEKNRLDKLIGSEKALVQDKTNINKKIMEDEEALKEADTRHKDIHTALIAEQGLLEVLKAELPESLDSEDKLKAAIVKAQESYSKLKKALEDAESKRSEANIQHAKAIASRTSAEDNLKQAEAELLISKERFMDAVGDCGFESPEDYYKNKLSENQAETLENDINEYNQRLKSISDSLIKAQQEIQGLQVVELKALEEELEGIKVHRKLIEEEKTGVYARRTHNEKIFESMAILKRDMLKAEEEYKAVGDLSNIANGRNSERISFERYVLAAFFDDIIHAANLRFTKMTGSRYEMGRMKEKGKGGGQSGLEIEVLDNYTGRTRHIKTLSGGESFKASLSLALGLADVVQSYAGGISMDTMFIDEGFGTLDPESLDNAILTLIELQSTGRLVGIISHVPELKERIDARLEIIPSKEGSTTAFNV